MQTIVPQALLIIDDHPVYREALAEILLKQFSTLGIDIKTASNANDGITLVDASEKNWVILLDVLMPGLNGLAGIKVFKQKHNVAHVVSISGLDTQIWEPKVVAAGATLFLSKNYTSLNIFQKLKPLFEDFQSNKAQSVAIEDHKFRLTQRQLEVLQLIALGHPNKIIADYLDIKEQTVKIHINQIFKELRVFNRTQAVLKAQKHQLLTAENVVSNHTP
ncbi:CitB Response regulator containing a CheY-like receiver domain and an HTH DNA-binding domain [Burkholderiaceae bacterium]